MSQTTNTKRLSMSLINQDETITVISGPKDLTLTLTLADLVSAVRELQDELKALRGSLIFNDRLSCPLDPSELDGFEMFADTHDTHMHATHWAQ